MANRNDVAFEAMNNVSADEEVDLTEDGEVSAWFPEGKFLGKKIPKGTAAIVEGLVFLGVGSPGKKVVGAISDQIKAKAPSLSPEMHGAVIMKASDYMKRVEQFNRKVALAGESGVGRMVGVEKFNRQLATESKAVADYAKRFKDVDFDYDKINWLGTSIPSAVRNVAQRVQPIGRRSLADVKLAPEAMKSFSKAQRMQDFADKWRGIQGLTAERQVGLGRQYAPAFEALGKFSIPMLVDELGE